MLHTERLHSYKRRIVLFGSTDGDQGT